MEHIDITILHAIPHPALLARGDRVSACNAAACDLFQALVPGQPLPEPLAGLDAADGLVCAGGGSWHFTASPMGEDTLYLLHPAHAGAELSAAQLDGVLRRLREQMGQLILSAQHMTQEMDIPPHQFTLIDRSLCQMLRLVNHVDLLRQLESDERPLRRMPLDLAGLCRELCVSAAPLLQLAGVELEYDAPLPTVLLRGDDQLLTMLVLELLSNAARSAGKGGKVVLTLDRRGRRALLTLSDTGRDDGRSLAQLLAGDPPGDRIPRPGEGAGLGLTLAQRVVALHQGALLMDRREGAGLTVTVALPLDAEDSTLPVRTPIPDSDGGLSPVLVALSDLLPAEAFLPADLE